MEGWNSWRVSTLNPEQERGMTSLIPIEDLAFHHAADEVSLSQPDHIVGLLCVDDGSDSEEVSKSVKQIRCHLRDRQTPVVRCRCVHLSDELAASRDRLYLADMLPQCVQTLVLDRCILPKTLKVPESIKDLVLYRCHGEVWAIVQPYLRRLVLYECHDLDCNKLLFPDHIVMLVTPAAADLDQKEEE